MKVKKSLDSSFPTKEDLKGTVIATLLYLGLYVVFLYYSSLTKRYLLHKKKREYEQSKYNEKKEDQRSALEKPRFRHIKYYNSNDPLALNGDRAVGNCLEWSFVFLSTLWMYAVFVDANRSQNLALLYIGFRSTWPFAFHLGIPFIFLCTVPQYGILTYMQYEIVTKFILV